MNPFPEVKLSFSELLSHFLSVPFALAQVFLLLASIGLPLVQARRPSRRALSLEGTLLSLGFTVVLLSNNLHLAFIAPTYLFLRALRLAPGHRMYLAPTAVLCVVSFFVPGLWALVCLSPIVCALSFPQWPSGRRSSPPSKGAQRTAEPTRP